MKNIKCFDLLLEPVKLGINVSSKRVRNAAEAVEVINEYYHLDKVNREQAIVLGMTGNGYITGIRQISIGEVGSTSVIPDEVFKFLLLTNSSHFIIFHCHPSGNVNPSKADEACTVRMIQCAKLMNLCMVDHIIIGRDDFCSIRADTTVFDLT